MSGSQQILSMRGAGFALGDQIVFKDTNWSIRRGEQWVVTGANSSGKSVFLDAISGMLPAVQGVLKYGFRPPAGFSPEEAIVKVTFEDRRRDAPESPWQVRWISIEEEASRRVSDFLSYDRVMDVNPFEVTDRHDKRRRSHAGRVRRAVRLLGIEGLMRQHVHTLSHGESQKVQLARALACGPRLLLLDEPFIGLDERARTSFRKVLGLIMREGMQLVIATSRPEDVPSRVSHCMLLSGLHVARTGRLRDFLRPPRSRTQMRSQWKSVAPGRQTRPPVVEMEDVSVSYGAQRVLSGLDWVVREGECWGLVGANGSGKSTLLGLITGDHPQAYSNTVRVFGRAYGAGRAISDVKRRIGALSPEQHLHVNPTTSCFAVVGSGFFETVGLSRRLGHEKHRLVRNWLRRLDLGDGSQEIGTLSIGMQRLVLLARALVKNPDLLLADEPCQGMDRDHRAQVFHTLDSYFRRHPRAAMIYVTHREDEIPKSVRRIRRLSF